ncbi:type II toxin-antitoxin system HipA family toxin [Thiohalocapsa sp. ML1]|uniref:type II toxin-antitoxin system HipA family toxin n=1 Tax=Thiohalocapsa sp. ML1 TaxID=1431688 RepID=UPI0007322945|nr:type II toxin-antitoxin system HipA family toxin [Thiohalocapsa sp. ML1]
MRDRFIVLLEDLPVGVLTRNDSDGSRFQLLESYRERYPRPVLGQTFLDDLTRVHSTRARLPPWFSNLLPEGPLRELVARRAGVSETRELKLLARLGEDLPGAVRVVPDPAEADMTYAPAADEGPEPAALPGEAQWRFSLAGVQLKFSAMKAERGLTIPVSGRGGDWILKLPDARYPRVPENEHATMRWAEQSGIPVSPLELVDLADVHGPPNALPPTGERVAFAVRRFDRNDDGSRVHMEDFAQILGLYPADKYRKYNYATIANLLLALTGLDGLGDFIRRLVFVVAAGNGDAHHKNWSLLYPDGMHAALSPAYDLVATVVYNPDDTLALNLAGSKRWEDVRLGSFRQLSERLGIDPGWMDGVVRSAVQDILGAWESSAGEFGYDAGAREALVRHMRRVPLLSAGVLGAAA